MYSHVSTTATPYPRGPSGVIGDSPSPDFTLSPFPKPMLLLPQQQLLGPAAEFEHNSPFSYSDGSSSGYNSPSGGGGQQGQSLMQRSVSSHNGFYGHLAHELLDDESPVRRAFSAGDLNRINVGQHAQRAESPLWSESNAIIEGMNRTSRYSPEEKKERIERYRSKRNLRNFNKRIKYECRKTLADSRPRIRGRFARNDEIERNPQTQWSQGVEEEEEEDTWINNYLDSFSASQFLNL